MRPVLHAASYLALGACLALSACLTGCGAGDAEAPQQVRSSCPTLDERLAPFSQWAEAGHLDATATILREDFDAEALRALTRVLLEVFAELPNGTLGEVGTALPAYDTAAMHALIARLFAPLLAEGEQADGAIATIGEVGAGCIDGPALAYVGTLTADTRLADGLSALLNVAALGGLLQTLQAIADAETRDALVAVLGNAVLSLSQPDFDPDPLRETLVAAAGLSDDVSVTMQGVVAVFDAATRTPEGSVDPERVAALSRLCGCVADRDPDRRLAGWLVDVLLAPGAILPPASATPLPIAPMLETLHNAAVGLASSPEGIDAVAVLLRALAVPARARLALPELRDLFGSGALAALGDAIAALALGGCEAP